MTPSQTESPSAPEAIENQRSHGGPSGTSVIDPGHPTLSLQPAGRGYPAAGILSRRRSAELDPWSPTVGPCGRRKDLIEHGDIGALIVKRLDAAPDASPDGGLSDAESETMLTEIM